MPNFLDENFLLQNKHSIELFHNYAKNMPIYDFHNHLCPQDIASNRKFENITQAILEGDHYKWRAMRANGIDEKYITGNAKDEDKFYQWAKTVPKTIRNPLFHWSHLEMQRYFNINKLINTQSAKEIYQETSLKLQQLPCHTLLENMKVKVICTTDDIISNLKYHKEIAEKNLSFKVFPTLRPDRLLNVKSKDYLDYIEKLSEISNTEIKNFSSLLQAIEIRHNFFAECGCKLSDHGINEVFFSEANNDQLEKIFSLIIAKKEIDSHQEEQIKTALLQQIARLNKKKNWVMQFHIGPLRNNNSKILNTIGADAGCDSMNDTPVAIKFSKLLDSLDKNDELPKSIAYNLNPKDSHMLATLIANFNDKSAIQKMQYGSAWWFLDQKNGMQEQLEIISNMGLISNFVGMLTDSRSLLSFPRHEYFRRILCNIFGNDIQNGEIPNDYQWIGGVIQDICYNNAKNYFQLI